MKFSLSISPCPNDTFIFDGMIHHHDEFEFDVYMEDVDQLNKWAFEQKHDIAKISFAAFLQLRKSYTLLNSGAALGHGVGPLLVSKNKIDYDSWDELDKIVRNSVIGIPGKTTTANLLLCSAFPKAGQKREIIFSDIENAVLTGEVDMGLLIHEGRFTYKDKGLHLIKDMGEWWEETHQLPIPLGCIVIKNELAEDYKPAIESAIKKSIQASWKRYPELSEFITSHAQEMSEEVMKSHIELYVNEESLQLSDNALKAINKLCEIHESI